MIASGKQAESINAYKDIPQFAAPQWLKDKVSSYKHGSITTDEKLMPYTNVNHYNNFYEFGYDKTDPANNAKSL